MTQGSGAPDAGLSMGLADSLAREMVAAQGAVDTAALFQRAQQEFLSSPTNYLRTFAIFGCDPAEGLVGIYDVARNASGVTEVAPLAGTAERLASGTLLVVAYSTAPGMRTLFYFHPDGHMSVLHNNEPSEPGWPMNPSVRTYRYERTEGGRADADAAVTAAVKAEEALPPRVGA